MRVYAFAGAGFRLETRTIAAVKAGAARAKNMLADQPPMVVRAELLNRSIFSNQVCGSCSARFGLLRLLFSFWPRVCCQQKLAPQYFSACCSVSLWRWHAFPPHSTSQRIYARHFISNLQSVHAQPAFLGKRSLVCAAL